MIAGALSCNTSAQGTTKPNHYTYAGEDYQGVIMNERFNWLEAILGMSLTGLLIGLGQVLVSEEKLTARIVIGRALSTVGLSLVAGLILIRIPDASLPVIIGLSALLASLGTSGLERFIQHYLGIDRRK